MSRAEISVTGNGATDSITLPIGEWVVEVSATTWDGCSVTVQESVSGDAFVNSDDPYNTGNALTRTANDKVVHFAGGVRLRLNVSSFGASTAGLKLIANPSSR
ncbi:hypothetical protein SH139x_002224 [Planctomycetaceae bacterium SH139]